MQIINTNEFNANQKKCFELAEKEPVYVTRENAPTLHQQYMGKYSIELFGYYDDK